jgi:hypothetical protein
MVNIQRQSCERGQVDTSVLSRSHAPLMIVCEGTNGRPSPASCPRCARPSHRPGSTEPPPGCAWPAFGCPCGHEKRALLDYDLPETGRRRRRGPRHRRPGRSGPDPSSLATIRTGGSDTGILRACRLTPTTPDHRARPHVNSTTSPSGKPTLRTHAASAPTTPSCTSTPGFSRYVCPRTAQLGYTIH